MPLPDLLAIARNPTAEGSGNEMKKVLLLLLGCAVQSDRKQEFVDRIKEMEVELQAAIVQQIQKITDNGECVLNVQALELDPDDQLTTTVLHQLQRVVKERDAYAQSVLELTQEQESDSSSGTSVCNGDVCARKLPEALQHDGRTPSPSNGDRHVSVELASTKAELRKIRNDAEEKGELLAELREDLAAKEAEVARLQHEKLELLRDARAAKDYRDELDCLQHKLTKLDRLEGDNARMREKLADLDFFRSRVDELREENGILSDTRTVLEEQLESWKRRATQQTDIESKWLDAQRTQHALQAELTQERDRLSELLTENARLEKECQNSLGKSALLEKELDMARNGPGTPRATMGTLQEQLVDSERSRMLELQLENTRLRSQLDQSNGTSTAEVDAMRERSETLKARIAELESEKNAMTETLTVCRAEADELRSDRDRLHQNLQDARRNFTDFQSDKERQLRADCERKVEDLRQSLDETRTQLEEAIAERKQADTELDRMRGEFKSVERRNVDSEQNVAEFEKRLLLLERDKRTLEKERTVLKEKLDASDTELEQVRTQLLDLERLERRAAACEQTATEARDKLCDVEAERKSFAQQLELETKKTARLRDDLVAEKTQSGDLLARLRTISNAMRLCSGDSALDEAAFLQTIDSKILDCWNAQRRETENLRIESQSRAAELDDVRQELEQLRRLESQWRSTTGGDSERMKELSEESRNAKEQVTIVQERVRALQQEALTKETQLAAARQEVQELRVHASAQARLQAELAKLQVSLRNTELQEELLRQDNEELQKQLERSDSQRTAARADLEAFKTMHSGLLADHDRLQTLHDQLTGDYDRSKHDIYQLKARLKDAKISSDEVHQAREAAFKERRTAEEMKSIIAMEREQKEHEFKTFVVLQNDHSELKRAHDALRAEYTTLRRDFDIIEPELRRARGVEQTARMHTAQLNNQIAELKDSLTKKDLEIAKLSHKIDMLSQLNSTLEMEGHKLLRQMDQLISQNQELLTRAMNDKEHFHAEEKDLQEKMNALRRHKDKLEEKIMDQYRMMDNKKYSKEKPTLVKRAAKALIPRSPARKSSNGRLLPATSTTEDSSAYSADEGGFQSPPRPPASLPSHGERRRSGDAPKSPSKTAIPAVHSPHIPKLVHDAQSSQPLFVRAPPISNETSPIYSIPKQRDRSPRRSPTATVAPTVAVAVSPPPPDPPTYGETMQRNRRRASFGLLLPARARQPLAPVVSPPGAAIPEQQTAFEYAERKSPRSPSKSPNGPRVISQGERPHSSYDNVGGLRPQVRGEPLRAIDDDDNEEEKKGWFERTNLRRSLSAKDDADESLKMSRGTLRRADPATLRANPGLQKQEQHHTAMRNYVETDSKRKGTAKKGRGRGGGGDDDGDGGLFGGGDKKRADHKWLGGAKGKKVEGMDIEAKVVQTFAVLF
uniref:HOOK N-terminal domain-containing protein n=1 Tax=Plectus sambesii TaxID=2011161 RepID=A0A914X4G4_9BILA